MKMLTALTGSALLMATLVPGGTADASGRDRGTSARSGRPADNVLTVDDREPVLISRPGGGFTARALVADESAASSALVQARRIVVSFHSDEEAGQIGSANPSEAAPTRRNIVLRTVNAETGESVVLRGDGAQIQLDSTR